MKFGQISVCASNLFLHIVGYYTIVWPYHNLFILSHLWMDICVVPVVVIVFFKVTINICL